MTTLNVRFEARNDALRRRMWELRAAWVVAHVAMIMQIGGAGVFVAGVAIMVGALAGVVYGVVAAMMLVGPLAFLWGFLREGGKI